MKLFDFDSMFPLITAMLSVVISLTSLLTVKLNNRK